MPELRYAARQLLKSPVFTVVAVAGLALGIGANVALFSVVNSVLLRPLPYREPDRLVRLASTDQENNRTRVGFSYLRFLDVQQRQQVFSDLALSATNTYTLTGPGGDPEQVMALHASAALLPTLGLQPIVGRNFSPDEDREGGPRVVMISQQMWQERFKRDTSALGQALMLEGVPYTIIGVLPDAATAFPLNQNQIWVPRPTEVAYLQALQGGSYYFRPIARLKPGVSLEQARAAMNVVAAGYRTAHPGNVDAPSIIELVPLLDDAVGARRQSYLLLFGAVACVLLIACANIANLLLARFAGRRREIAARFALGASRAEVVRQLVLESTLLAALGGAVGLLLARWALSVLVALSADLIPRAADISIDPLALGFTLIATLVTGLLIGLLPAMHASSVNVLDVLKAAGPASVGLGGRLRGGLLVVEVSLSLVLLIAAGLLLTSFARLQRVDPGFQAEGVFTAQIVLPRYYSAAQRIEFYHQFYQRFATLPDASIGALSDRVPLTGDQTPTVVAVGGRPVPPLSERATATRHLVSPSYFRTLGIRLRAGRDFDERDNTRVPDVVIINETFARRHFPGEDPLGRTLVTGMVQRPARVVAVVADIRGEYLNTPPEAEYFLPVLQRPEGTTNVLVRSHLPPAAVARQVREALRTIDPDLPLLQPDALTTRIAQTVANRKLALMLLSAFAALALVLASLGVYSVMAHLVAFRTGEIGLRMALGASHHAVMRMVLGQAGRLTVVGIIFGIGGALVVSRLMRQTLFEVDPADPGVYLALSVMLLLVAGCASFFPARRAMRIDPVIALRTE
ncbi:MAG TPA: ABC transporter permease [Vicinamibacterales bacterium]|nr:ABC transporter permease [Vicinamibacterales bacterium]